MTFQLYDYQQNLVDKARKQLTTNQGVLIVSPAGSGKSIVIAEIARLTTMKQNHVLFMVHSQELVSQIRETFKQNGVDPKYTTVMTVGKIKNRLERLPYPSLIITDETHHSRAKTYTTIYNYYDQSFRLGFTASPWRMNGKGFTDIYDTMIEGPTVEWLINNHFLAPYKYFAPTLADLDALKKSSTGDYSKKSMDKAVNKTIFGDVVKHYKTIADGKQTILYAHSIEASKQIAESFTNEGIRAVHVDGKTPQSQRKKIMNEFRNGDIRILTNVDIVSEGFDVPDCSCVILLRPTASLVLHIQQSMRSMRYKPNKQATIIDHVGNYEKHGLPDTNREWTIEDREKQKKKKSDNEQPTKTCEFCFAVIPSQTRICPECQHELPYEESEFDHVDTELKEVNPVQFKVNYTKIRYKKKSIEDLETLEDYYLFAKARNYKETWIKFQKSELKHLTWPQFFMKLKPIKQKYKDII